MLGPLLDQRSEHPIVEQALMHGRRGPGEEVGGQYHEGRRWKEGEYDADCAEGERQEATGHQEPATRTTGNHRFGLGWLRHSGLRHSQ